MKNRSVLIVVEAIPPVCGGGEQVAWNHAEHLAKYEDVSLMTFGDEFKVEKRNGIKLYFLKNHKNRLGYYLTKGQKHIKKFLREIKPDIIHYHMPFILSTCIKKGNSVAVSTIHDGVPENQLWELEPRPLLKHIKVRLIRKLNIFRSDYITCVSRHSCSLMKSLYKYKQDRFIAIPNGINDRFLKPASQIKGDYILNFGRQIDLKVGSLIEAARAMPDEAFKFIGTGPMVKDYGLENIEFLGFKADFLDYIDSSSICVFPSKSENFPLVGLEAMARGKPVIASEKGFSEYIKDGENGIIINDNDPDIICAAIKRLLTDQNLFEKISKNARATAELFSFDKIVAMYNNFYDRILADPNTSLDSIPIDY